MCVEHEEIARGRTFQGKSGAPAVVFRIRSAQRLNDWKHMEIDQISLIYLI